MMYQNMRRFQLLHVGMEVQLLIILFLLIFETALIIPIRVLLSLMKN